MKCLFLTVVWGDDYIEEFLKFSLPTQMSQNNLCDTIFADSSYLILTNKKHFNKIGAHKNILALKSLVDVGLVSIDHISADDKYQKASLAQLHGLTLSENFDFVFFIYPDFICADGVMAKNAKRMADGWDAIMAPVPAILDKFYDSHLIKDCASFEKGFHQINILPDQLVRASFQYFHPMINGYNLDIKTNHMHSPVYFIRNVQNEGLLIQAFHLHPIVIRVQKNNPYYLHQFQVSLDEEYVTQLFKTIDNIYFPASIEEFAYCSIRTSESVPQPFHGPIEFITFQRWAEFGASMLQRQLATIPFYWGVLIENDEGKSALDAAKIKNSEMIERLNYRLNASDMVIAAEDQPSFEFRKKRRDRFRRFKEPTFLNFLNLESYIHRPAEKNASRLLRTLKRFESWFWRGNLV